MDAIRKVEVLRAACCVAGIDGETSKKEYHIVKMLADEVGVGDASLSAMISRAETDTSFYSEQFGVLKAEPKETMQLLFGVALADDKLTDAELEVLERLADQLEVSREKYNTWLGQVRQYLDSRKSTDEQ